MMRCKGTFPSTFLPVAVHTMKSSSLHIMVLQIVGSIGVGFATAPARSVDCCHMKSVQTTAVSSYPVFVR